MSPAGTSDVSTSEQREGGTNTVPTQASTFAEGQGGESRSQTREKTLSGGETREQSTTSGSYSTATAPTSFGDVSSSTADDIKAREQIDSLVESFQNGKASKSETLYRILSIISRTSYPNTVKTQSSYEYMRLFDDIERQRESREKRGNHDVTVGPDGTKPSSKDGNELGRRDGPGDDESREQSPARDDVDQFLQSIMLGKRKGRDNDIEAIEYDPIARKRRIDPSKTPWAAGEKIAREHGDPHFQKTFAILEYLGRDLTESERLLTTSITAPSGFPTSQWKRIISGQSIDFDVIYSNRHHYTGAGSSRGGNGSGEGSSKSSDSSSSISTQGEWSTTFKLYRRALLFVFSHRASELDDYEEYIDRLFSAQHKDAHHRVIRFERAVREEVAGGQRRKPKKQ